MKDKPSSLAGCRKPN